MSTVNYTYQYSTLTFTPIFAVLLDTGRPVSLRLKRQDNSETGLLLWNVVTYA